MKKMRIRMLSVGTALAALMLMSSVAFALPTLPTLPVPTFVEFDLDNWTRLYRDGVVVPTTGANNQPGDESRAILTFNQFGPTLGAGGADLPVSWVGGFSDGTYLHGFENNVVVSPISALLPAGGYSAEGGGVVTQADGSVNYYFSHAGGWEFEVYQTQVNTTKLITDSRYLQGGPTTMDTIQSNIVTPPDGETTEPFVRGTFAESVYFDPALAAGGYNEGLGVGIISATVAIHIDIPGVIGGFWIDQLTHPYGLSVNAFVDVDPLWGYGALFQEAFYGYSPSNGDPYDLAVQNVRLFSELFFGDDGELWVISDDGVRGSTIPEPATMLLLGTGLVGLGGAVRRKNKKQA